MDFSLSTLIVGFVFGVIGYSIFRRGQKQVNFQLLMIGIGLMVLPPLPTPVWQQWGLGCLLCCFAYYVWQ